MLHQSKLSQFNRLFVLITAPAISMCHMLESVLNNRDLSFIDYFLWLVSFIVTVVFSFRMKQSFSRNNSRYDFNSRLIRDLFNEESLSTRLTAILLPLTIYSGFMFTVYSHLTLYGVTPYSLLVGGHLISYLLFVALINRN